MSERQPTRTFPRRPLADRFAEKVAPPNDNGCMLWRGATDARSGYGKIGAGGREGTLNAHRVAYELAFGPIPSGMDVCHRCDVPGCVNPSHLFLGTRADNMRDCVVKNRHAHGETSYSKVTEAQVLEIRRRHAGGETCTALGLEFGVTMQAAWSIATRKNWRHV